MTDISGFITQLSIWALPTILAIILHEVMHGVVARGFGDDTAQRAGRLTLNPLAHVDPFGTLIMPLILIFLHLPVLTVLPKKSLLQDRPIVFRRAGSSAGDRPFAVVAARRETTDFAAAGGL